MTTFRHDLRFAVRQLARNPGFTAAAVLILALGIGLSSAVFSLVNATLFRPLPVAAPDDLVAIFSSAPSDFMASSPLAPGDYEDLTERSHSFTSLLAYMYTPLALEHEGENRLVLGVRATPNFFTTLGVKPFLGRFFTADDPDSQEAVLSYSAWQRRFGADPDVLGAKLLLNGQPCTVIGVAPEEFFGLTRGVSPELWMPRHLRATHQDRSQGRALRSWWVMGRRAPGTTFSQARAELRSLAARLAEEFPATNGDRTLVAFPANTVRILPGVDAKLGAASAVVLGVVGLVLLIACTNVANLFLARALARRREIATRRALGAGTAAVVRQLLIESLLLALLGGAAGLGLARASNLAVEALRLPLPIDLALGLALDGRVILFTLAAATVTALVFGLAPALAAARGDLTTMLREGAPTASRAQRRLAGLLVVVQMAFSLVLLVDTGLAVRSLRNAQRLDPGFEPRGVVVATFAPRLQGYTHTETEAFFQRLTERVRALPGVEAAGLASHLPLSVEITFERVTATGTAAAATPPERWPSVDTALVGPGYFEALRIPRLRGRTFTASDREGAPLVAVVNESFAVRFWPRQEAVGQRLRVASVAADYEVVGVVRDGKYRTLGEAPHPFLYRDVDQNRWLKTSHTGEITAGSETLVVRTRKAAPAALAELRQVIREVDEGIAIARLETLEDTLGVALFLPRLAAVLFAVLGLLGLVLATVGIYGLMVYTVGQRTREIGIRMALGATRRDIVRLIVRRGLRLALLGIATGLAVAAATTRTLSAVLYGISATDAPTFLTVAALLALVALAASLLPARRAAAVDVLKALREE
jgi:putative ABC transport system permease protein